jgi:hypothetical protein
MGFTVTNRRIVATDAIADPARLRGAVVADEFS